MRKERGKKDRGSRRHTAIRLIPRRSLLAFLIVGALVQGCTSMPVYRRDSLSILTERHGRYTETGWASYYGSEFSGRSTSSGEIFDMHALTAAHRRLPLGTVVRVTNITNSRAVTVTINDRGPFKRGRILDLSYGAAKTIGMIGAGTAKVRLEVITWGVATELEGK